MCPMTNSPKKQHTEDGHLLPCDIIANALLTLPFESNIQFSRVSKWWHGFICGPDFSKMYFKLASEQNAISQRLLINTGLKFQTLDVLETPFLSRVRNLTFPFKQGKQDGIRLLGSCNGLVVVGRPSNQGYRDLSLWNPSTRYFLKLPHNPVFGTKPKMAREITSEYYGFGYVSSVDDYKFVFVHHMIASTGSLAKFAFLYSVRNNSWKSTEVPPRRCYLRHNLGALLNETLHWVSRDINRPTITAFDLATEQFRQVPMPVLNNYTIAKQMGVLILLGECLCVWCSNPVSDDIEFWVMKEYNVCESWTLLYKFNVANFLGLSKVPSRVVNWKPVWVTESGTVVFKVIHTRELIRIEFHKEEKPVYSGRYKLEEVPEGSWSFDAIQYDQTLISVAN